MLKKAWLRIINQQDKQIALFLLLTTFFLRVCYSIFSYCFQPLPETNLYYELGQEIITQGKFFYDTSNPYYEIVGPIIPWITALTMLVFGVNYMGLYLITSIASALTTYYTYKVARLFLDKTTALFAGIWSAFYLFYFYFTPTPGKDIWMAFFMIYLIYLFLTLFIQKTFSYAKYILFIVMYVISFHLDERFFIFAPLIFFYILYNETYSLSKFIIKKLILFTGLVILFMMPWSIRNYFKHGEIVIISTRTKVLTDKILGYQSNKFNADYFMDLHGRYYIHDYQIDSIINGTKTVTDGGYIISEKQKQAMLKGKLPRPLNFYEAFWIRTKDILRPFQIHGEYQKTGYFYYEKSLRQNIASFLFYGPLFFFSFAGFFSLYKTKRNICHLFVSIILIYTLIHSFFIPWTTWRYRLPLDAIFIMMGCYGMVVCYNYIKNKLLKQV